MQNRSLSLLWEEGINDKIPKKATSESRNICIKVQGYYPVLLIGLSCIYNY